MSQALQHIPHKGKLEHSKHARIETPTAADYTAQQQLLVREKCVRWLQNEGSGISMYQFGSDRNAPTSSWSPARIERLLQGKNSPKGAVGVYANEPALRAMAVVGWQNLVVFDRCCGSNIQYPEFRNQPADRVSVYLPGHSKVMQIVKFKSWACDIVPALLEPKRAAQYTVIVHNGDMPGSGPL